LFGPVEVRIQGGPMPCTRTRKGEWAFALLVLRAGRAVERAWLAGSLWPDHPLGEALALLRRELTALRHSLGTEAKRLISPTTLTLRLDLNGAHADVLEFDRYIAHGDLASLERAVALYRGPLLEGCSEEWALLERRLREEAYLR